MAGEKFAWRLTSVALLILAAALIVRCSQGYKDPKTGAGAQVMIDQINNDLTAGDCDAALALVQPIVASSASNEQFIMLLSAAYACKGGVSVPNIIGSLNNSNGADVWSTLVKADPSNGNDGHLAALNSAATTLYLTGTPNNLTSADARPSDANTYMIFIEAMTIATVIGPAGNADPATGNKRQSIATDTVSTDECQVQVAVAQMNDSLKYVTLSGNVGSLSSSLTTVCASVAGGCPSNESLSTCLADPVLQAAGQAILVGIDNIWQ